MATWCWPRLWARMPESANPGLQAGFKNEDGRRSLRSAPLDAGRAQSVLEGLQYLRSFLLILQIQRGEERKLTLLTVDDRTAS
jgi:hypothetical protein